MPIKRYYRLTREKAAKKMADSAESIASYGLHLDRLARHGIKVAAQNPLRAIATPLVHLLGPAQNAIAPLECPVEKPAKPLVLICDDEELILDLLEHHLCNVGYEVMRAADGDIAIQCLSKRTPAVVILAMMLPGVSGIEVLQRIRENPEQRNVPVVMLTDRTAEEDVVNALRLGASDYLTKPFLVGEVLERVNQHLSNY